MRHKRITKELQLNYKRITKELQIMKARKSSPKSIRFNINDFSIGMEIGKFESAQELVDVLLRNYVLSNEKPKEKLNLPKEEEAEGIIKLEKELSKGELLRLMRKDKQ